MSIEIDPYALLGQPSEAPPEEHAEATPPTDEAPPVEAPHPVDYGAYARINGLPDITTCEDWHHAYIVTRDAALRHLENSRALRAKVLRLEALLAPYRPTPPDFTKAEQPPKRSQLPPTPTPKEN